MTKTGQVKTKQVLKAIDYLQAGQQEQFKQIGTLIGMVNSLNERVAELEGRPLQNVNQAGIIVPKDYVDAES